MITSKDIETFYRTNNFGGEGTLEEIEQSEQELRDAGMDIEDVKQWATEHVGDMGMMAATAGMPPDFLAYGVFMSALRIGFFLGRGYQED